MKIMIYQRQGFPFRLHIWMETPNARDGGGWPLGSLPRTRGLYGGGSRGFAVGESGATKTAPGKTNIIHERGPFTKTKMVINSDEW